MANKRKLTIDKTYLSLDQAETRGFIHRDYIAHCLRWTHVVKRLTLRQAYKTANILDVGCGRELPLARLLYSSRLIPAGYTGVDVGPIEDESLEIVQGSGIFPITCYEHFNFPTDELPPNSRFNVITCFEVLEHVEPQQCARMLAAMRDLLMPDGTMFLSTPCWNRQDCAANHVDEMTYGCFGSMLEDLGLEIDDHFGTFASQRDYVHALSPKTHELFDQLSEYYDSNFLSCVFAPIVPQHSRNVLWRVKLPAPGAARAFPPLTEQSQPLGSSAEWESMGHWWPALLSELNPA